MQAMDSPELVFLTQQLNSIRYNSYFLSGKLEAFVSTFGSAPQVKTKKRAHSSDTNNLASESSFNSAVQDDLSVLASAVDTLTRPTRERSGSMSNGSVSTINTNAFRKPGRRRTSSLGDLSEPSSRALLEDLITALNDNFPDYDFSDSKVNHQFHVLSE